MKAYNYQIKAVEQTQSGKANLYVVPMGGGKSYIMKLIQDKFQFKNVLIIVGFRKIVLQLETYFKDSTFILSGKDFDNSKTVHIGTFQTLSNRDIDLSQYDCVMTDEFHSRLSKAAKDVIFLSNTTKCLFTGTPLDNKNRKITKDIDNWIQPVTIKELIEDGKLAPTRFLINSNMLSDNAAALQGNKQDYDETVVRRIIQKEDLLGLIRDKILEEELHLCHKTVVYVNYIQTAEELYTKLSDLPNVYLVHSKVPTKQQEELLSQYEKSTNGIIISVRSLSLGWDSPTTDRVIYGIFTKIHSLALQALWRGSRIDKNNPNKETIVYDMTGQLSTVNPYTDFKEYGKEKDSCKKQCEEFPENSIARDMCLESCTGSEEMFIICDGKPSYTFEEDLYKSDYRTQGKPCKEGHPFYEYKYWTKRPENSVGVLHKYAQCPCGFTSRYTLHTMTQPSKVVELYRDEIIQNNVMVLVKPKSRLALLIIDDLKEKKSYTYQYVRGQEEAYEAMLTYFKGRKFSIISNVSLNKIKGSQHESKLDYLLQYVDWEDITSQEVIKQLITSKLRRYVAKAGFKRGFTYLITKHVNYTNEKEIYNKVKKDMGRTSLKSLLKKLNE